jgi:hypothetical protein
MADPFAAPLNDLTSAAAELESLGMPAAEILANVNDALERPADLDLE